MSLILCVSNLPPVSPILCVLTSMSLILCDPLQCRFSSAFYPCPYSLCTQHHPYVPNSLDTSKSVSIPLPSLNPCNASFLSFCLLLVSLTCEDITYGKCIDPYISLFTIELESFVTKTRYTTHQAAHTRRLHLLIPH